MPRGVMSEERKAALVKARQEYNIQNQDNRANAVVVGKYRVYRLDSYNVVVQEGNNEGGRGHYPDWPSAVTALFRLLVEPKDKATVEGLLKAIQTAEANILKAVTERIVD